MQSFIASVSENTKYKEYNQGRPTQEGHNMPMLARKLPILQGGLGPTSVRPHTFLSASGGRAVIISNTDHQD